VDLCVGQLRELGGRRNHPPVNKVMGGSYFAIEILDLEGDANAPRPRGL
jgi:hypothetical protein